MNAIQKNYQETLKAYDDHFASNEWTEETDEALYQALEDAKNELIDWGFNKAMSIAYLNEKAQLAPLFEARQNDTLKWRQNEDRIVDLALKL